MPPAGDAPGMAPAEAPGGRPGPAGPGCVPQAAAVPVAGRGSEQPGPVHAGVAPRRAAGEWHSPPQLVLFDRDGTLVVDVPYNRDPDRVRPMPTASAALGMLRAHGVAVGVVTNQPGLARGLITPEQMAAVQRRIETLLGPFEVWAVCPHRPQEGCRCRKPAPGLVLDACLRLGVDPGRAAVVGDIGADIDAAKASGARGVLVPTRATRPEEVGGAPQAAPDLLTAVRRLMRELREAA
jgi:D-glycero-D-manno-heptose 1,7-bisphosphate phosphatase